MIYVYEYIRIRFLMKHNLTFKFHDMREPSELCTSCCGGDDVHTKVGSRYLTMILKWVVGGKEEYNQVVLYNKWKVGGMEDYNRDVFYNK